MAAMAEGAGEPELVSIPVTPRGLSTPEGMSTPPVRRGGAATSGAGTPVRRVVEGLRGYLEEVGHLTRLNPQDAWLPITESRSGNASYAAFHSLNAGLGFQALLLPLAFPALGWSWGIISLTVAYFWQLYTLSILVKLHEAVPGRRYNRYVELAQAAFGEKLGVWLALFPTIYLSAGTATALILVGGETMKLFYQIVCGPLCTPSPISTVEWYLVFTSLAVILSQLPNLNSIAGLSLIGGATAIMYCTMSWVLSVSQQRPAAVSYEQVRSTSFGSSLFSTLNALGIIAFAFRGHNLSLEIQATMPSTFKHPAHVPMWRGAKAAYLLIAMCIFPVAIGGYWAYGNMMPPGGILTALYIFHGHDISRGLLAATFLLVVFNCLSSFQIYSMPVFDSFEAFYTGRTNRPCSVWVRSGFRIFYGFISLFIGIALPFLSSLAGLLGGLTLPVTFAYPCFMWICIKKPERFSYSWYVNWGLALLGTAFSLASSVGGVWSIINTGMKLKFFKPN
ncbi:lysine histidine transporter-like 8 [Triticum dicoccoides]|uniref:lysine histidine transporter-like 8 n=1 Tax=Triticum dicoccoides TaxID=85692 RepID=UPI00188EE5E7|nr:lysine histidine transporter-like 8 [Triticum dicoccoides]